MKSLRAVGHGRFVAGIVATVVLLVSVTGSSSAAYGMAVGQDAPCSSYGMVAAVHDVGARRVDTHFTLMGGLPLERYSLGVEYAGGGVAASGDGAIQTDAFGNAETFKFRVPRGKRTVYRLFLTSETNKCRLKGQVPRR